MTVEQLNRVLELDEESVIKAAIKFYEDYLDYKLTQDFIRYHIVRSDLKDAITSITEVGNDRFVRNITKILRMKLMVIGKVIL